MITLFFQFGLHISSNKIESSDSFLAKKEKIIEMITLIDNNNWNGAKYKWLVEICKINPIKEKNGNLLIDCFGSVNEFFSNHIRYIQT